MLTNFHDISYYMLIRQLALESVIFMEVTYEVYLNYTSNF